MQYNKTRKCIQGKQGIYVFVLLFTETREETIIYSNKTEKLLENPVFQLLKMNEWILLGGQHNAHHQQAL